MKHIEIGGKDFDDLQVMRDGRLRPVIGKVMTASGLQDFYRPINFKDTMQQLKNIIFLESPTVVRSPDGLKFFAKTSYAVYQTGLILENGFDAGHWMFEKWGASPENISNQPHDNGWKIQHINTGHASGAMYTPLPSLDAGTLVIEFDWRPVPDQTYTGAFVNIRGADPDRNVYYGRTNTSTKATLRAYSYNNVMIELDSAAKEDLSPLVTELARYRIEIDVINRTISFYVNGALEQSYDGFVYEDGLFFELTFGGYSGNKFSFIDNVKIEVI